MSTAGSSQPSFDFRDEPSFEASKASLGLSESEIDEHMWAIENMLLDGPAEWSAPLPSDPGLRVAVSDSTPHSPHALRLVIRIDGTIIERLHVERRGFTPIP